MSTELQTIQTQNGTLAPLRASDVRAQVNLIQEVMRDVMQGPTTIDGREVPGVHYGTVPGCGDKPTLLQPGAHKLLMTFRLVADPDMTVIPMERGHREVRCKVKIYSQSGVLLGAGVGTCSTMEGKYRYRTGPVEFTDKPVPREYWDLRNSNPAKAKALLGEGLIPKKNEAGAWVCARQGEKVEHDNPADYYNTVEKMAYKRALVSATLTVTAASDIFTQDIEDMPEVITGAQPAKAVQPAEPTKAAEPEKKAGPDKGAAVLDKMKKGNGNGEAKPAAPASAPAPAPAPGVPAEWLSQVLDLEDALRQSEVGKNTLRSIRAGFNLEGDAYPMFSDHQAEYLDTLKRSAARFGIK